MSHCQTIVSFPKTCQRCSAEFACGLCCCWCDEIAVDADVAAKLRGRFSDCLCRSCLLAEIEAAREVEREATVL